MYPTTKRVFDFFVSAIGLLLSAPLWLIVSVLIKLDSTGSVFFRQERIGKAGKPFRIWKFRTMVADAPLLGNPLTSGADPRITKIGHVLRKFKIDELPQLINVFLGDMSFVGPRPEVPKYVAHYSAQERAVLALKPGITAVSSVKFSNENELLGGIENPEDKYIKEIMPEKIKLDLAYAENASIWTDCTLIWQTVFKVATH